MTKLLVHTDADVAAAAAVVLETPTGDYNLQPVVSPTVLVDSSVDGTAADAAPTAADDDSPTTGNPPAPDGEQLQMREPHISMLYEKEDVMVKHFGVTQEQALRTQALLRLGVTDEDVRIAERLMASRSAGDNTQSKAEWLLGYTHAQMSYHKALEVLGVSEAVVEEERARRLGELGLNGRTSVPDSFIGREGDDICRGFFTKRRRSASQDATSSLGTTLPGTVAFPPTTTRVLQLEEVCQSQQNRIEQLESQLAALSAKSRSSTDE